MTNSNATTVYSKRAAMLSDILEKNGLFSKTAQEIKHISNPTKAQNDLGAEQQAAANASNEGTTASNPAAVKSAPATTNIPAEVQKDPLKPADAVLSQTGSKVEDMCPDGCASSGPATVAKAASLLNKLNAVTAAAEKAQYIAKQASLQKQAAANFRTGRQVMNKIAALSNDIHNEALAAEIEDDFIKIAAYNPAFAIAREQVAIRKLAAEVEALADAEGIPPEQAADALDASIANDPEAQAELADEIDGEALTDLAGAEGEADDLMAGLDEAAAQASEMTGEDVTPEDIVSAVSDVVDQAEQLGVSPEELLSVAAEQMLQQQGEDQVSPEDEQAAQAILDDAAAQGISPDEVVQGLSEQVAAAPEEAAATEEAPVDADTVEKTAALNNLVATKRGANLFSLLNH